jgi:hypothetical protein
MVFFIKFILAGIIPDVPSNIILAKKRVRLEL